MSGPASERDRLDTLIAAALDESDLTYTRHGDGRFLVTLPGTAHQQPGRCVRLPPPGRGPA